MQKFTKYASTLNIPLKREQNKANNKSYISDIKNPRHIAETNTSRVQVRS